MHPLDHFEFSQSSLQDYVDCRRRFQLRYLERIAWPALPAEPARENEQHIQRGERFHRLAQQFLLGISPERLMRAAAADADEHLVDWWINFLDTIPAELEGERHVEVTLDAPLERFRLVAKYDLLLFRPNGAITIYDWKTSLRRPSRERLLARLQTRIYPYLLVQAAAALTGQAIEPEQVQMIYWFADPAQPPERLDYSLERCQADEQYLRGLVREIAALPADDYNLASSDRACKFCVYRSLCDRGAQAGLLNDDDFELDDDPPDGLIFDLEQIGEIRLMPASSASKGLLRDWIEPQPVNVPADFQAAVGGHPLVAEILVRRGIQPYPRAEAFLNPQAYTPTPPAALPDLITACERIEHAIQQGERICVWGDFDVDGQTSTTLLVAALRDLGADLVYHIPVRARESHGVNIENLAPLLDGGARLVVTCDTGISAHEALEYARQRGVAVIVTDHHDLPESLPPALALVNPKRLAGEHALSGLPGVGVAYKLAEALYQRAGRPEAAHALLDLTALGIVADLANQTADTRYLLQRGLPVLRQTQRTGLQVMYELSGLQAAHLTEEHIGFVLGPRLNALGRLDDANPAVELLTTSDAGRARVIATHLEGLNARRRLLTSQVLRAAQLQIEKDASLLEQAVLVLSHAEWPAGVIGIVASELAERYNRPTLLLATPPGQPARGSARSVEGVNITAAIASQQQLLLGFGGHPMAAGLSLDPANLTALRHGLSRYVEQITGGVTPRPTLPIDGQLTLADLSLALVADLERLAPFGPGNPPLTLVIPRLSILSSSTIGREGDHLQITVKDEHDQAQRVIWWRGAGWPLPEGVFDLACTVRASDFRGQRDVQVEWVDARPVAEAVLDLRPRLTIIDQRGLDHPIPVLQSLLSETPALIWAEAEAGERLAQAHLTVSDRTHLTSAETLVIWSTPPGRSELQAALAAVQPQTVIIFSVDPANGSPAGFLKRLAGLAKYTLEKHNGQVSLARLAAATAQRESAVKLGLHWLQARGLFQCAFQAEGQVELTPGQGRDVQKTTLLEDQIRSLLEETAAYRNYFKKAEKENSALIQYIIFGIPSPRPALNLSMRRTAG